MKRILIAIVLATTLTLGACQTTNVKVSTKYTDPDTGAVIWVVYEDSNVEGFIEYTDPDTGFVTKIKYTKDSVTGTITYINPETGLETTIELYDNTERG